MFGSPAAGRDHSSDRRGGFLRDSEWSWRIGILYKLSSDLADCTERSSLRAFRFSPAIRFALGDGWSTVLAEHDIIVLGRDTGVLTFASGLTAVYPSGGNAAQAPGSARGLVEAFVTTDGVAARKPSTGRVDKRRATIVDLSLTSPARLALFATSDQTYYLEPHRTTRVIVVDGQDGRSSSRSSPPMARTGNLLPAAISVIDSLRFR